MDIEKVKWDLKKLLRENQIGKLFQKLWVYIPENRIAINDCTLLNARYNEIRSDEIDDSTDPQNQKNKNILKRQLLEFVEGLQEDDLKGFVREITYEEFYVVTMDSTKKEAMKKIFPKDYFPNRKIVIGKEIFQKNKFDFLIFDFYIYDKINNSDYEKKLPPTLKEYLFILSELVSKNHFIIFLGNYYYKLEDWREQVHAANSKFALYARIREMIEYLKYNPPIEDGDIIDPEN